MQNTILISAATVASLPLIPVGHFLFFGWLTRKRQIISQFSNQSIARYRETFYPEASFSNSQEFAGEYDRRYGLRLYWLPVPLFVITTVFLSYLTMSWVFSHDWLSTTDGTAKVAIFSLAGAYVWATYDLILRARQNDVVTSDINRATLRLFVSLPFGFAISAFAGIIPGSEVTLSSGALAFFVGAFPTDTVLKFMRRTAGSRLKLDADKENVQELTRIDGINVPIAERLIDEGVKTNLQLAYADPIALTIKTGMDFSFILDCCGQALVRMYFDDEQMKIVRKFGLRTCLEVKGLNDDLLGYYEAIKMAAEAGIAPRPTEDQAAAQALLEDFARALTLDAAATWFIIGQIAEDPYTKFEWDIWYV